MNARRRRQTRTRRIGAGGYPPYKHNADRAQRASLQRLSAAAKRASGGLRDLATAFEAVLVPSAASFSFAWALRDKVEHERTVSHALLLGMDETEAHEMIEDFRQTRASSSSVREWEDLRDEITYICLGARPAPTLR